MVSEWMQMNIADCYKDLSSGQLPIDDHHILDWLANHRNVIYEYTREEDLDDVLEEFCNGVKEEEARAKTIAAAANGGGTE